MDEAYEQIHQLRALAMRVAALEDNVAYLEQWCEEQQDTLDRTAGPVGYDYEAGGEITLPARAPLRIVDLRDCDGTAGDEDDDADAIVAFVETDHDRRVDQIRVRLNGIRTRLAASLAPASEAPAARPRRPAAPRTKAGQNVSAKPAGRTAP
jgi:hypothetical protein